MRIYLSEYIHPAAVAKIRERAEIVTTFDEPETIDAIILRVVPVTRELMEKMPRLKVIGKHGVGYDSIDIEAARELGKRVIFTPGTNTESVAELSVAMMLNVSRNLSLSSELARAGKIRKVGPEELKGNELAGKTVGLIGCGNIGRRIGEILEKGFSMTKLGYDPYAPDEVFEKAGIRRFADLREMLREADFINISVPLTEGTRKLIGEEELSCCRKDAVLVNVSRGGIVDEGALYRALKDGKLRAAASDVFDQEPPTGEDPLMQLPNFFGTPHMGGDTEEAGRRVGMAVVEDVFRVLDGREPLHPVV